MSTMPEILDVMAQQGKAAAQLNASLKDLADLAREWEKQPSTAHCGRVLRGRLAELGFHPPVFPDLDSGVSP